MNQNSQLHDLIVIGGGAAGFFSAITYAEYTGGSKSVLILEKSSQVLGKVKISGGGRCNVTHACFEPKPLTQHYPRGSKSLIGPFHRWGATETVDWFSHRGVELKTEADGRMFPITDSSQTVIDCLVSSAQKSGVITQTSTGVKSISHGDGVFHLLTDQGTALTSRAIILATGGTRLAAGARLAQSLGHELIPNAPSLFAFNISDPRISQLPGVSVPNAGISIQGIKLEARGPLLITHHGLSGPGVLKLSAWGARELHDLDYQFSITINWLPDHDVESRLIEIRQEWGKRLVKGRAPFDVFPKRLWEKLCLAAGVAENCIWSQLSKTCAQKLANELTAGSYQVSGKSINKDEFVTCGGVKLTDVNLKTMESKIQPKLYFAGEILNIDGITGGFNFQNAWTSGHIAGESATQSVQ
ncbi:MAG: NAD(P)/FAD-dependent oxidoreductase [Akkermansiaceae bacterium]